MTETKTVKGEILFHKKIKVRPIMREGGFLPKGHDGEFMYSGCKRGYCLPVDANKGTLVPVLNEVEQEFFEKQLGLGAGMMSPYRKKENFWHKFYVTVQKEGMDLNLADTMDNLRWRLLKVHPEIAPTWEDRFNSPSYKFALMDEEVEIHDKVKQAESKKAIYKFLSSIEDSRSKMYDVLRFLGRKPAATASKEWMIGELEKTVESIKGRKDLLAIISDPLYDMKLFIEDGIVAGGLRRFGRDSYAVIGLDRTFSQPELIEFLSPRGNNQDIYLKIKTQIDGYRKATL